MTSEIEPRARRLVFSDKELEEAYGKLHNSSSKAGKRLHAFIARALKLLTENYQNGRQLQSNEIPKAYKRLVNLENLWVLNIPPDWRIFYSLVADEILIVDMTCDKPS